MTTEKKVTAKKAEKKVVTKKVIKPGSEKLVNPDLTKYVKVVTGEGKEKVSHIDVDDLTAKELRTHTLEEVYELTSLFSAMSVNDLKKRYHSLNTGMQRMNLGNRIRAFVKEGNYSSMKEAIHDAKQAQKKAN